MHFLTHFIIRSPIVRRGVVGVLFLLLFGSSVAQAQELATVSIPGIGVVAPIVAAPLKDYGNGVVTWDVDSLRMTVGHMTGLSWFGEGGNVVLGGHSEGARGEPDVFFRLNEVNVGDEIIVNVNGNDLRYVVVDKRNVGQHDLSILYPTMHEQLTIMTCDVDSFSGGRNYTRRHVIIAIPA